MIKSDNLNSSFSTKGVKSEPVNWACGARFLASQNFLIFQYRMPQLRHRSFAWTLKITNYNLSVNIG